MPCRPTGGLPNPGITPASSMAPALQADSLPPSHCESPIQYLPLPSFIYSELWFSTGASQVVLVVKKKKKKNQPANAGDTRDTGSIPGSGRSPGKGNGNPFQYSCLGNPLDRGSWQATVHGVVKSQTRLKDSVHTHI